MTLVVVEEECGKAVARPRVNNDGSIPPANAGWSHEEGVYGVDGNGKRVATDRVFVRGDGWWRRDEV